MKAARVLMAAALAVVSTGCAARQRPIVESYGVESCAPRAAEALLSVDALECWFPARHGQWRTLSQESHYAVLVVHVEAFDVRDAEEITRRFVANQGRTFFEIMVYAQTHSSTGPARIRRVRWTREQGIDAFDLAGPE